MPEWRRRDSELHSHTPAFAALRVLRPVVVRLPLLLQVYVVTVYRPYRVMWRQLPALPGFMVTITSCDSLG